MAPNFLHYRRDHLKPQTLKFDDHHNKQRTKQYRGFSSLEAEKSRLFTVLLFNVFFKLLYFLIVYCFNIVQFYHGFKLYSFIMVLNCSVYHSFKLFSLS